MFSKVKISLSILIAILIITAFGCSNSDLESQIETQKNQIENLIIQISSLEDEISSKEDELSQSMQKISQLDLELKNIKAENGLLKDEVYLLNEEIFKLQQEVNNLDISDPAIAKEIIENDSNEMIYLLSQKEFVHFSDHIHPVYGLRLTPYTYVSENDLVFEREDIRNAESDSTKYMWGYSQGPGEEILLTISEYFEKYVYDEDYANAEQVGYNEIVSFTGMIENQFDFYENAIIVEYYFSGFNPEYEGLDWTSLRLVFQKHEGHWYLSGLIHNEWTP